MFIMGTLKVARVPELAYTKVADEEFHMQMQPTMGMSPSDFGTMDARSAADTVPQHNIKITMRLPVVIFSLFSSHPMPYTATSNLL